MPTTAQDRSPRTSIPPVPVLSLASFADARDASSGALPSLLDGADVRQVSSGRIAIGLALRGLGVGPGDTVLVPAYHSPSMIPPVLWCGAKVAFYRIHPDTTADLDDVGVLLAAGGVRAVMATHFFGVPQDLSALRDMCERHGAGLIEDCAHCFFGERNGVAVGSTGDFAIGSSMKFFPIYEGGCLVSRRRVLDVALRSAGAGFEAKAALAALETGFAYGRLAGLRVALSLPLRLKSLLWSALKSRAAAGGPAPALAPASSDSAFDFDPHWLDKRSSMFSRFVLARTSRQRIVALRRRHYLALQCALDGVPGWRPLWPVLPDGACPWVFPLLAERADSVARRLKEAGVPMVRFGATLWPGVDATVCANSAALGRQLIGLPCHQDLSPGELAAMIAALRAALQAELQADPLLPA